MPEYLSPGLQTYGISPGSGYLQPFVAIKPENESRTNTVTITRDRDLVVPINPNAVMYWRARLFFYTAAGSPGNANSQWSTPAAPLAGGLQSKYTNAAGAVINATAFIVATAYNNPVFNFDTNGAGATGLYTVAFEGMLINGNNGGYFSFDWAQNGANATATVLVKGSRLECWFQ